MLSSTSSKASSGLSYSHSRRAFSTTLAATISLSRVVFPVPGGPLTDITSFAGYLRVEPPRPTARFTATCCIKLKEYLLGQRPIGVAPAPNTSEKKSARSARSSSSSPSRRSISPQADSFLKPPSRYAATRDSDPSRRSSKDPDLLHSSFIMEMSFAKNE